MTRDPGDSEKKLDPGASGEKQHAQGAKKFFIVTHWHSITILLLVLAIAGMYAWKNVAVTSAKAQVAESVQTGSLQNRTSRFFVLLLCRLPGRCAAR